MCTVFIDFTKAFDMLDRSLVLKKVQETIGHSCAEIHIIKRLLVYN
jgi:hypothetical protein